MTARGDVVSAARALINTPFVHQGRLPGVALDCVGLVVAAARDALGLGPEFDYTGYGRVPDGRTFLAICDRLMTRIDSSAAQLGDVIALRYQQHPQHMGVLADYLHGGMSIIHALGTSDGRGRVVEHSLDPDTVARCMAVYRLPGVPE